MSNVSNRHTVVAFESGKTKPLSNQRLAKVGYKNTKNQKAKYAPIAVSVPFLKDEDVLERMNDLVPYVKGMLENAQDGIIKSLYESNEGILSSVSDDEIGIDAIIGYLENESNGGRLTKVMVEEWFVQNVQDNLYVVIAEKLGFTSGDPAYNLTKEQEKVIEQHLNAYKGIISSLSGGKTILNPMQITGCRKALDMCMDDEDEIKVKLVKRLDRMETPVKIEELLEL